MKFTNPDFLWALFLVSLPVIIHLFNFRRFKKVYFSNLRFLKTVEQQTKRHSQLRHILVLFSRILFIVFLVLAFAKPYRVNSEKKLNTGVQKKVAVFLDNSFSMQQKGRRGVLLEEGRSLSREIVQSYRPTDKFVFVTNDIQSFGGTFLSRDDYMSDLRECDFQPYSMPVSGVIDELASKANQTSEKPTDIFIISDFQKSSTDIEKWNADSNINIWLLPLTSAGANNIYIDSCWLDEPVTLQDKPVEIHFNLAKNFDEEAENITVKLIVNGVQKGVQTQTFSKRVQEIKFLFRPDSMQMQFGVLEVDDYPISFDNKFYFSFSVRKNFVVTMVNGDKESDFIRRFYESDSSIHLQSFAQNQVDYSAFTGSDILILNQLDKFSSGLLDEVKKYTENGGRLIFIPSDKATVEETNNFNRFFLLPAVTATDSFKLFLNDLDLKSEIFKDVFEVKNNQLPENIDLPYFKFRNKIKWPVESNVKRVMVLGDGSPLLISRGIGLGRLYYFTASVNQSNSNLGRHALFIPLFYNFALTVNTDAVLYHTIGDEQIIMRNLPSQKESPYHIKNIETTMDFIPGLRESTGEKTFFLQGNILSSGSFTLSNSGEILAPLSFNYPSRESNLDNYSVFELKKLIKKFGLNNVKVLDNQKVNIGSVLADSHNGEQLWKIFILMALMFLLIELFLLRFLK